MFKFIDQVFKFSAKYFLEYIIAKKMGIKHIINSQNKTH
ncbi:protein of unknown function [Clostridium beijerinckii]|nr:protein of unknown function [Clostridium beijerinckii]